VPSKQVNANILPATNLRASSAVIIPASAGMIVTTAVTAPNTKRASIAKLQLHQSGGSDVSLPAAYHTNRGDIEAAWLVKSEYP
jgi:hypothetical protein